MAAEPFKVALSIDYLIKARLQEQYGEKGRDKDLYEMKRHGRSVQVRHGRILLDREAIGKLSAKARNLFPTFTGML